MLDATTKSRIDSARDILVGKVPDPKSQVEQITIALIYKFMDDMDRESEELGGKASFFSDGYKKYAWHKLIDPRLSGHERLMLYAEGLEKMNANEHIPQLFRDIFKGAFLPYRDPETLNLFLKEINGFTYDHSERLGDAFEYLLSVLGSQGEAGQFRTPRHIIDFIVSIVDPQKNETVLDPACGTAGFLISAYKHILAANSKDGKGDLLTGDERAQLMDNFCGYDISPDMVRLSRANMYLHGFPQPRIHEYDTLTSEERWDERYDVIMANPPFMTPKGGIRPHNRFSIKATRSEVLFVDYIAEHLNVNGRAGVIVPEGVIFQSQNAYKNLRKMLVENYLWCIVSLPAGVFNPYSGVKTSILLMDKALAKRIDEIMFVKIVNDGLDLGAQRRPIDQNDLPEALKAVLSWKHEGKTDTSADAHSVTRKRILQSSDVNLSGDRYRTVYQRSSGNWPMVKLGSIVNITTGKLNANAADPKGLYPFYTCSSETLRINTSAFNGEAVLLAGNGEFGVKYHERGPFNAYQRTYVIKANSTDLILNRYLFYVLQPFVRGLISQGGVIQYLRLPQLTEGEIPLPPLPEQERMVAELEGYRLVIESARQILNEYKPSFVTDSRWPMKPIGEVAEVYQPKTITGADILARGPYKVFGANGVIGFYDKFNHEQPEIAVTCRGATCGTVNFTEPRSWITGNAMVVSPKDETLDKRFLFYVLRASDLSGVISGSAQPQITRQLFAPFEIPVPPVEVQRALVMELDSEQALVDANRELIARMEKKMQAKLAEIWGESEEAKQ